VTKVIRDVRPEEVRSSARHTLFVEGKDDSAIDPTVLRALLRGRVTVRGLGPSFHVRSAAEALHKHHPDYYFLVDRDHYDDAFVERCWRNFPDPATSNLLVWRRRELENYFLIPEYLLHSAYLTASEDKLRRAILTACQKRVFFDAANLVIIWIREELKENWIELFKRASELGTREQALSRLKERREFAARKGSVGTTVGKRAITKKFDSVVRRMTGNGAGLEFGRGEWLHLVKGKKVLPTVASRCFRAKDADGRLVRGRDGLNEVVKELVARPLAEQPDDFQELHALIRKRVSLTR